MKTNKFRAWADGRMWYPNEDRDDWWFMSNNGYWSLNNGDSSYIVLCDSLESKDPSIMQYTGLKDKNCQDIYEGDILRFPPKDNYEKDNFSAFEVFFHDNDCADRHIGFQMSRMHNYGAIAGGFSGHTFLPKTVKRMAIIGNIYELTEHVQCQDT